MAAEVRGAAAVATNFSGRAQAAQLALVNGAVGVVWAPGGRPRVAFVFTLTNAKIVAIDMIGNPEQIGQLDVQILGN
jgi:RNA polymerase sigma-70 factor (ECF subfamily)